VLDSNDSLHHGFGHKNGFTPLFPFGHSLSYTTIEYSNLNVGLVGDEVDVSFDITNTGLVAGMETWLTSPAVQLFGYHRSLEPDLDRGQCYLA
jgi:hypothetical protein